MEALDQSKLGEKEQKIYMSVISTMKQVYSEVRNISHTLMPKEFEDNGFIIAIEKIMRDLNQSEKIKFVFVNKTISFTETKQIEFELYNICLLYTSRCV